MTAPTVPIPSAQSTYSRRHNRRTRIIILLLIVGVIGGVAIKNGRRYIFAKAFRVVVPGQLYRSGYCEPWPLTRVIREYKIKTILVLLKDAPDSADQRKEEAVAAREGVRMIRIGMPGDGLADFDLLDQAADVIADSSLYPLLVHCHAGVNRTGAAYAVWRMRHCGWNYSQVVDDCEDGVFSHHYVTKLGDHLKRYYAERIEAGRAGGKPESTPDSRPAE